MRYGLVILLALGSCASKPPVYVEPARAQDWFDDARLSILNSEWVSTHTRVFLRMRGLDETLSTVQLLDKEMHATKSREIAFVLAELCFKLARTDLHAGAVFNHACAEYAYAFEVDPRLEPPIEASDVRHVWALELYHRAVARIVRESTEVPTQFTTVAATIPVAPAQEDLRWDLDDFVAFVPAYDFKPIGFRWRPRGAGIGVPCIATFEVNRPEIAARVRLQSPDTDARTLFLRFTGSILDEWRDAVFELYDPHVHETLTVEGQTIPIEYDFTTTLAWSATQHPWPDGTALMKDGELLRNVWGLYLTTPHRKGRIPIVFVHGLKSTPTTFIRLYNELVSDPELRRKYEFWFFYYPTGFPIIVTADAFRKSLVAARAALGEDPALDKMVLIGHSMGGLLSKAQAQAGGEKIWKVVADRPLDDLDLSDADKADLRRMIYFKPLPFVGRTVFIATPHRGSRDADNIVGWFGKLIIKFPDDYKAWEERISKALGDKGGWTSVHSLSRNSPTLRVLAEEAITVPFHSIMGDEEEAGRKGGSDGVVEYASAHLDGAESESIVKANHATPQFPACWREVRRILYLHLR